MKFRDRVTCQHEFYMMVYATKHINILASEKQEYFTFY